MSSKSHNIVHIAKYYRPHVGGVETHVEEINKLLVEKNRRVNIITLGYQKSLKLKIREIPW